MGFFDNLMDFVGGTTKAVVYAVGTIAGITAELAQDFVIRVKEAYNDYRNRNLPTGDKNLKNDIRNINDEIIDLELKRRRDRFLNEYDEQKLSDLYKLRENLKRQFQSKKEIDVASKIYNGDGEYNSINVENFNLHILQFHVGQTVSGKYCRSCGRPMVLQWQKSKQVINLDDLFWGCTGYYQNICHNIEPFLATDMRLLTKVDRPEFEISANQLNNILKLPSASNNVNTRMKNIKNESTDNYLCAIHGEPLILREKHNANGLLDQYFLSCPRWKPNNHGCNFVVTIKSAAQLASVLESFMGRGIL